MIQFLLITAGIVVLVLICKHVAKNHSRYFKDRT